MPAAAAVKSIKVGGDLVIRGIYRDNIDFDKEADDPAAAWLMSTTRLWVGAELTDYTFIRPAAPGAVRERARNAAEFSFGAYDFPIVSSRSTIVELPDQLVVTPNPPAPGAGTVAPDSVSQGQADVPLLQLQMHATDDEVVLSRMKVDATSGAGWIDATQHLTVLRLYIDMDRNGLIDAGDILLAESNFSMAGTPLRPQAVLQLEAAMPCFLPQYAATASSKRGI